MNKNYGLNWELELAQQSPQDRLLGSSKEVDIAPIPRKVRGKYLPIGEVQAGIQDTMDCASRAPINILEHKFNYLLSNNLLTDVEKAFLINNNYITDGGIEFSDAFIAIKSGTTEQGNSLKAPLQAIRDYGLIPKALLPLKKTMTFAEYHNPARITKTMENLGKEFNGLFKAFYERIEASQFDDYLEKDVLDTAGYAWTFPDDDGIYPASDFQPNHAFETWELKYFAFDNYRDSFDGDFIKHLAEDYKFMDYGYSVGIARVPQPVEEPVITEKEEEMSTLIENIVDLIIRVFKRLFMIK